DPIGESFVVKWRVSCEYNLRLPLAAIVFEMPLGDAGSLLFFCHQPLLEPWNVVTIRHVNLGVENDRF
ncbi:hypothetical protein PFISCL1PPCAC_14179, partial [Pristionchus fissidentatus]